MRQEPLHWEFRNNGADKQTLRIQLSPWMENRLAGMSRYLHHAMNTKIRSHCQIGYWEEYPSPGSWFTYRCHRWWTEISCDAIYPNHTCSLSEMLFSPIKRRLSSGSCCKLLLTSLVRWIREFYCEKFQIQYLSIFSWKSKKKCAQNVRFSLVLLLLFCRSLIKL